MYVEQYNVIEMLYETRCWNYYSLFANSRILLELRNSRFILLYSLLKEYSALTSKLNVSNVKT